MPASSDRQLPSPAGAARGRLRVLTAHVRHGGRRVVVPWPATGADPAKEPAPEPQRQSALTLDQKRTLYHTGWVVLRGVVPLDVVAKARHHLATMDRAATGRRVQAGLGGGDELLLLLTESPLRDILVDLNGGSFDAGGKWTVQPAITPPPASPATEISPAVAFSRGLHLDGRRPNGNDNGTMFIDSANTVSIRPFQNFVFVSCSDQREPGAGQTHLLPGGHLAMEEFFSWQLATHGKAGSHKCEGWGGPREWPHAGIPTMVREFYNSSEEISTVAPDDGQRWPLPVPLLLGPGDACISTFSIPHTASRNERGPEREQVIFRFQPDELRGGKIGGKGLPELSGEAEACVMDNIRAQITDCWRGWGGMATVAREERPATEKLRSELQRWFAQHGSAVAWDE